MKNHISVIAAGFFLLARLATHAEVTVTVGHNENGDTNPGFKFSNVPSPSTNDAATGAKFVIVDGERDPNGGDVDKLDHFRQTSHGGRPARRKFLLQCRNPRGTAASGSGQRDQCPKQVNTYSWHPNTRGPQVYKLYASDGAAQGFQAAPKNETDPETCGWKLIAKVNTKAKNPEDDGGQYGVSISDTNGALGKYRYLLFDMAHTEGNDDFGNTFYCEIDVIDANAAVTAQIENQKSADQTTSPARFSINSADGKCEITINTVAAPELKEWAEGTLAPVLAGWYPKIVALLPSEGFTAPAHFSLTLKPMDGVAYTAGTKVVANSTWLGNELHGEAAGSLVHEMVHVVQQFNGDNPGWLVEGSADYIRWFKYEPQKYMATDIVWMRRVRRNFNYDGSYRITANFLNYVTEKYDKNIVTEMNAAMRQGQYDDKLWEKYTGKTVQQLGAEWKDDVKKEIATGDASSSAR